ncbi:tRNA (adenosine(37)-N6)-threonylcarbamoyltransferase complex dimerization subunit type 1 TsaB [Maribacter polysiphoniae]|uniref:tRNA (Adenosine(37)-N6)-threonylcarbamoyltransferase complex dimerization subunit type 1 TsaB n=1 Tax=Maribacter polysiphoniae TaxID=429344 RepID=A0A316E1E2_9FLAO|nr:tRNA (adenosine(37)-N6)-threonylcarbamoyltransferase complex dimerization subunit type 1 TsaB [Maribacter polysiphoniae]MBD1259572.1 tRNA (adenosine(37)-N6)-threonylcarbamoyltransferase complex dimerization subunit type 1 TsaB [Maribacter polysiphoniae]PWK23289.1 tRNA threonylcarbamoyladenosine biosynthesis protein TsaB [Maribacter polysiphoniae]
MALILNLETATTNCSVSIAKDGDVVAIKEHNTPNFSHSEQLHVFVEEVLREASLDKNDLDAVAVSKGPGSYTGLRIGVSAAKGLCYALDLPLISVPTLRSMAEQAKASEFDFIVPLLDARRMEVYSTVFDGDLKEVRGTKAEIIDGESFQEYASKGKVLLLGSGAEKCMGVIEHENVTYNTVVVPSAREMGILSFRKYQDKEFEDVAYFEPYYLKDFMMQRKKS